jgi:hypothetical protein
VLYDRLADLPIDLERYRLERRETQVSSEFTRVTTLVVMEGAGHTGVGEDVTYTAEDHDGFPADLPLAGHHSLDELSQLIDPTTCSRRPAGDGRVPDYRRWAFESAALDLGCSRRSGRWPTRPGARRGRCASCSRRGGTSPPGSSSTRGASSSSTPSRRGTSR